MTKFVDSVTISGTKRRDDGYLVADAKVARSGIQLYAGFELGKPEKEIIRVYRPPEEVFSKDSMASFTHRPVTNDHPSEAVTADNWREYSVGNTTEEIARDGEFIRIPLMVADAAAIKDIENGKRELSAGYSADLEWIAGVTDAGESYDAVQRNIHANHVAIVDRGRAGPKVRIGDEWGAKPLPHVKDNRKEVVKMSDALRKIMVDGLQVETTEAGEAAIRKLQNDCDNVTKKLDKAISDHAAVLADKDAELAKKDAEIDKLKENQLDAAKIDKLVADRAELVSTVQKIAPKVETKGLSDAEIRKAVVIDRIGADRVKDKPEAYIDARFDGIVEDFADGDKTTSALSGMRPNVRDSDDTGAAKAEKDARQAMIDRMKPKKSNA